MFADYFLTVTGAIWKERKYDEHFKAPFYELNPALQKSVSAKKWWNAKHVLMTAVLTAVLLWMVEFAGLPEFFVRGFLAAIIVFFGALLGRHVYNLLMFARMRREPSEISGQVTMAHSLVTVLALYQCFMVLIPLVLLALLSPAPSTVGGVAGLVLLSVVHLDWIRKYRKEGAKGGADTRAERMIG